VLEAADGSLSAVWENHRAADAASGELISFLKYAFQSHRYSGFAITDTTPDLSYPQWAREWNAEKTYSVLIDRDIGLQYYSQWYYGGLGYDRHTASYNLLTFQAEAPVGIVPRPTHRGLNTRIRFDGKPVLFEGRRLDGRRAVRASAHPASRD
jgi:hypothetical protein